MTKDHIALKSTTRNSSIELLRIIAMLMIVFHHFAAHGKFNFNYTNISTQRFWYSLILMGGKIGVNLFVLISGYFLINNKKITFNFKKILKFWLQVFFYSISIYFLFGITHINNNSINLKTFFKTLLPITYSSWWFASTYFFLYLIHPFLNKFLLMLEKDSFQKLLIILVICSYILPTLSKYLNNRLLYFVCLYSIASYIKIYGLNSKFKRKHYFVLWALFSILTYFSSIIFIILGTKWPVFSVNFSYFYNEAKLPTLLISLSLFMFFATTKMKYNRLINIIASATFGVYLIHDSVIVRPFLWTNVFKNSSYQESNMLIIYSIAVVVIVYIVCTTIDLLRQYLIEKPFVIVINTYADSWLKPFDKIITITKNIVFGK